MALAKGNASDSCELDIRVQPRSSQTKVCFQNGWKVWVTAPPVDGQANVAVIEALAKAFGVPKSAVTLIRGESGRDKRVRVAGRTEAECLASVGAAKLFE